jgi:hypothetical protein
MGRPTLCLGGVLHCKPVPFELTERVRATGYFEARAHKPFKIGDVTLAKIQVSFETYQFVDLPELEPFDVFVLSGVDAKLLAAAFVAGARWAKGHPL